MPITVFSYHCENLQSQAIVSYYISGIWPIKVEPVMNVTAGILLVTYVPKDIIDVAQDMQSFDKLQLYCWKTNLIDYSVDDYKSLNEMISIKVLVGHVVLAVSIPGEVRKFCNK
jgi:hypothetical protein